MKEDQLHNLYVFLTEKFAGIDARFDENELVHNEILNVVGKELNRVNRMLESHEKRISKLETHAV